MAKMYQIVVLVCALIASVVSDAAMDAFLEHKAQTRKICQEKTKVSTELIDGLSTGTFPEGNKDIKCYVACAMEQMKSMKDGKMDKATAMQTIDAHMPESLRDGAKKALNICSGKFDSVTDPCDLAWEMVKCWKNEDPGFKFA